jgi:hypothetical protein
MKATSRTLLCIGILILLAVWPITAQQKQSQDADLLRAKIEQFEKTDISSKSSSVQSIYQRTLLRLYDQFSLALRQDIAELKAMQDVVSGTNSESQKEIVNQIQKLRQEQDEIAEKIQTLKGDLQMAMSPAQRTPESAFVSTNSTAKMTTAVYNRTLAPSTTDSVSGPSSIDAIPASDSLATRISAARPAPGPQDAQLPAPSIDVPLVAGKDTITGHKAFPNAEVEARINHSTISASLAPNWDNKADSNGNFELKLSTTLSKGDEVQVRQKAGTILTPWSSAVVVVAEAPKETPNEAVNLRNPGPHLTGLLLGGVVVSQQEKNFSQADPFFGFIAGYDSRTKAGGGIMHYRVQGIFQVQPQTAMAPKATATTPTTPTPVDPTNFLPFLASRKTFDIDTHFWIDYPLTPGIVRIGPYIGVGASTFVDKNELKGDETVTKDTSSSGTSTETKLDPSLGQASNDLKRYYEAGVIGNFLRNDGKLFMTTQFLYGNYEALAGLVPGHDTRKRFIGRLRIFPTGLKLALSEKADESPVSMTPMFGVELNAGRGPDQLKFFTGVAISITKFKPFAPPEKADAATSTTSGGGTTPQ